MLQLQAVGGVTFQKVSNGENAQPPIAGWHAGLKMAHGNVLKPTYWEQQNLHKQLIGKMPVSTALFPPGKGGGENVEYGYKGKGVTIHALIDGQGMPLAVCSTSAKVYEPTQVEPLLDSIFLLHGQVGRPRKRPNCLQADAGYDTKNLRSKLKHRGIRARISKNQRARKTQKSGRPLLKPIDRWKCERTFAWLQRKFRRLVVRWERRNNYWQGFLAFCVCYLWIERILVG